MSHRASHRRCEGRPRRERRVGHRYRRGLYRGDKISPQAERALIERAYRHHVRQSLHMWYEPRWERRQRRTMC